jgi:hypothetical protein
MTNGKFEWKTWLDSVDGRPHRCVFDDAFEAGRVRVVMDY